MVVGSKIAGAAVTPTQLLPGWRSRNEQSTWRAFSSEVI